MCGHRRPGKVSTAMSFASRIRSRREMNRQNRAFARAWRTAPTQASREEILFFAQRTPF